MERKGDKMKVKTEQLRDGSVMMTGEVVANVKVQEVCGGFRKWVECILVNRKNNKFRKAIYDFGNTIFIKSL